MLRKKTQGRPKGILNSKSSLDFEKNLLVLYILFSYEYIFSPLMVEWKQSSSCGRSPAVSQME